MDSSKFRKLKAGIEVLAKLLVPASAGDPAGVADNWLWINTATGKLSWRVGGVTQSSALTSELGGGGLTQEQVEDIVGALTIDNSHLDFTYTDNGAGAGTIVATVKTGVVDAATLGGQTSAQIQAAAVATVLGGASAAWDTLQELKALLDASDTADDSALATLTTSVGLRGRFYDGTITSGATTATVTHGYTLTNIGSFTARCYVAATGVEEEYDVKPKPGTESTQLVVTDESGANIPAGRRIFVVVGV